MWGCRMSVELTIDQRTGVGWAPRLRTCRFSSGDGRPAANVTYVSGSDRGWLDPRAGLEPHPSVNRVLCIPGKP
jgi:hypothetical protein